MTVIKAERTADTDQAAAAATAGVEEVEGEIRAFVRRDVSVFRRRQQESGDAAVESINSVIERVSGASVAEIERVMAELANVRDMLRGEGERVQREIGGYASLSQAVDENHRRQSGAMEIPSAAGRGSQGLILPLASGPAK